MPALIAVDAGTTGVRAFAVDGEGRPCGFSYRELTQYFPRPGWVEHDPAEIWTAVQTTLAELVERLTGEGTSVAAVGITNQRETVVAWDRRTGQPLHRALVWQDRRTAERCDALKEAGQEAGPGRPRASSSTPTSPPPRWNGSSARAGSIPPPLAWPSGRSTPGWPGT